jgi:hypothetical protein
MGANCPAGLRTLLRGANFGATGGACRKTGLGTLAERCVLVQLVAELLTDARLLEGGAP